MHSPYLFELLSFMRDKKRQYYIFEEIEQLRWKLLKDKTKVTLEDYGAGSNNGDQPIKSVGQIARSALSPAGQCQDMYRLAEFLKAKKILEMGTSLGISTMYLAANHQRKVTALEGDSSLVKYVDQHAKQLEIKNLRIVEGPFLETLPTVVSDSPKMDLIFMDGHHAEQPTIDYFHMLQPLIGEATVVIVDDIYWSKGMEQAWMHLKNHPRVTQTIDFFFFGLLFFRKEFLSKEHHLFR